MIIYLHFIHLINGICISCLFYEYFSNFLLCTISACYIICICAMNWHNKPCSSCRLPANWPNWKKCSLGKLRPVFGQKSIRSIGFFGCAACVAHKFWAPPAATRTRTHTHIRAKPNYRNEFLDLFVSGAEGCLKWKCATWKFGTYVYAENR